MIRQINFEMFYEDPLGQESSGGGVSGRAIFVFFYQIGTFWGSSPVDTFFEYWIFSLMCLHVFIKLGLEI